MENVLNNLTNKFEKMEINHHVDTLTDDDHILITEQNLNFVINLRKNIDKNYNCVIFLSFNMLINNQFVAWVTNEVSKAIDDHEKYLLVTGEYFYISKNGNMIFGKEADKVYESENINNKAMINSFYKIDPSDCYRA